MPIDVEREGGAAVVTVNRPEALNALDLEHAARFATGSRSWPPTRRRGSSC